jgi:hypothetical protein
MSQESITIHVDKVEYKVSSESMSGADLRGVPQPPVPSDRDLWLEVPGGDDVKIEGDKTYQLKNGMHFFTAPANINPGA